MKYSVKLTLVLLSMFFLTQIIGLVVINAYAAHNDIIPYGMSPPTDITPASSLLSIIFAIVFAVVLMLLLMKFRVALFLRLWFFIVITIALGITLNALFMNTPLSNKILNLGLFSIDAASLLALVISLPLASIKVFNRNLVVHNLTELLIYPGIAVIFVPLLNLWTVILLLVLISLYDMYAVWQAGFMQKMAKYQINNLKVFGGFFVPYIGKKEKELIKNARSKGIKSKKIKVNVAILGGGDVVFPLILAGVVLRQLGLVPALITSLGATLALMGLFYLSKKGKFYPAMPFISAGCFIGLGIAQIISLF